MDINKLPIEIQFVIMEYLENYYFIYKKLYSKKLQKYTDIYNNILKDNSKAYIISGTSQYKRKTRVDYQIYQFSNYLYVSKKELLADFNGESPAPTYLRNKLNTLNIFIYEIIKILKNKNILQRYYPGIIKDVMIGIQDYEKTYNFYEKINEDSIIKLNSFSNSTSS